MPEWEDICRGYLPAIPASTVWSAQQVAPSVAQGVASALYRLKNGESIILTLPASSTTVLTDVARALHLMRMEAMMGECRASWFNGPVMQILTDLVIWTRSVRQYTLMRQFPDQRVQSLSLDYVSGQLKQHITNHHQGLRTLLCQQNAQITALCAAISQGAHPFANIVDLTGFGYREDPKELIEHLNEYFPGVPMLILTSQGDMAMARQLPALFPRTAQWDQHVNDPAPLVASQPVARVVRMIEVPDQRLDKHLIRVANLCRDLHHALNGQLRLQKVASKPLYRVLSLIRDLAMDITHYESLLDRKRQGGPFPVRPLADWLTLVERKSMPTAESTDLRDRAISGFRELLRMLEGGKTGKHQALLHWLQAEGKPSDRALIVVRSSREAKYLLDWLSVDYSMEIMGGRLAVIGASSVQDAYRILSNSFERVLVMGQLWESDYWTALMGHNTTWLAYPSEIPWFRRIGKQLSVLLSPREAHKADWWRLRPVPPQLPVIGDNLLPEESWGNCRGQYVIEQTIILDLPEDPDWIANLMAEVTEPEIRDEKIEQPRKGEVTILTDTGGHYRYGENQWIYMLFDDGFNERLKRLPAQQAVVGGQIILIDDEHGEMPSLTDLLIDYAVENATEYRTFQANVDRWFAYVDRAIHKCGTVANLHRQIKQLGVPIGLEAVKNWGRHIGIAPKQKNKIVPLVIKIAQPASTKADADLVIQSQRKIHGLHTTMGRLIRKLTVSASTNTVTVEGSASKLLDYQALSGFIRAEEILEVIYHAGAEETQTSETLEDILREAVNASRGRLVATPSAYSSAVESPFKDTNRARHCLRLLIDDYYRVYANSKDIQLSEAIDKGRPYRIDFKGDTSAVTKGKYRSHYFKLYNNEQVDIGKHLGIGDSGSPERCLRLHFHWDDQQQQIVIHHMGRHLPTSEGA